MRIIVGVSGASGSILAYRFCQALKQQGHEIRLVMSDAALRTWELECETPVEELYKTVDQVCDNHNIAAEIASGSFRTDAMVILPCSMKTLAGIVSGYSDNLLLRAADVCLKEGRKLILCPREMPLSEIHLRNMYEAARLGCRILPPMMTFYDHPGTLEDEITHFTGKLMMQLGLELQEFKAWEGA